LGRVQAPKSEAVFTVTRVENVGESRPWAQFSFRSREEG